MAPFLFLVIDENPDSRFLLVRTLVRKFPTAAIREAITVDQAFAVCRLPALTAIVVHRSVESAGLTLIPELRAFCPQTPIVAVSNIDRAEASIAAGANAFLLYDEWLRIGTIVGQLIAKGVARSKPLEPEPDSV